MVYFGYDARIFQLDKQGMVQAIAGNGRVPLSVAAVQQQLGVLPAGRAEISPDSLAIDRGGDIIMADHVTSTIRELLRR